MQYHEKALETLAAEGVCFAGEKLKVIQLSCRLIKYIQRLLLRIQIRLMRSSCGLSWPLSHQLIKEGSCRYFGLLHKMGANELGP